MSWAKLVAWPCPDESVPSTTSIAPSGRTVMWARSRGNAGVELDVVGHADAAIAAAAARLGPARLERPPSPRARPPGPARPGSRRCRRRGRRRSGTAWRPRARGSSRRSSSRSNPCRARGEVDQPLHHEHDLGAPRAAVRRGRRRVGDDGAPAHRHGGHAVDRRRDRHALVERVERDGVGADVAGVGAAKREEGAVGVERELGVHREVAALVVGEESPRAARPSTSRAGRAAAPPTRPARTPDSSCCACRNFRPRRAPPRAPRSPATPRAPATPVRVRPRPPAPAWTV